MTMTSSPATLRLSGVTMAPWLPLEGEEADDYNMVALARFCRRMHGTVIEQTETDLTVRFPSLREAAVTLERITQSWLYDQASITHEQEAPQAGAQPEAQGAGSQGAG